MIPLPWSVDAEVTILELQNVGVESGSCVRVANIENSNVHPCCGDKQLTPICILGRVFHPVANANKLTSSISVLPRQTWKLTYNAKNIILIRSLIIFKILLYMYTAAKYMLLLIRDKKFL